jgi:hypothetical protein
MTSKVPPAVAATEAADVAVVLPRGHGPAAAAAAAKTPAPTTPAALGAANARPGCPGPWNDSRTSRVLGVSARAADAPAAARRSAAIAPKSAAAAVSTCPADGLGIGDRQMLDRDCTGIDEQAALGTAPVERIGITIDDQRNARSETDRLRRGRLGDVADKVDRIGTGSSKGVRGLECRIQFCFRSD